MSTQENYTDDIHGFSADMGRLCMNELYSDVEFVVEDQRLSAHRLVLAARSEYFRAMLYGDMAEAKEREIRLEVPLEAFKIILEYLYSGKLSLSTLDVDKIIDVFNLANLYGLEHVETAVPKHLQKTITVSNVCEIMNAARRYDLMQLSQECFNFMDKNVTGLLKNDSILMLSKKLFEEFLLRDSLFVPEVEIFRSVCKWRDNNPNEDIQNLFSLVRLPLMSIDILLHVVRPSGIYEMAQLLDAIDQVNTGKNLPYRTIMLPGKDVASDEFLPLYKNKNDKELVVQLRQLFVINYISVVNISKNEVYTVEVSCDQIHWECVKSHSAEQTLSQTSSTRLDSRPVRYIRITFTLFLLLWRMDSSPDPKVIAKYIP